MKRSLLIGLGIGVFWVVWLPLFLALYFGKRSRVVVVHGDDILLVKGWLGDGKWVLPGGGIHRGEQPVSGAVRELREEAGIEVAEDQLQPLFSKRIKTNAHFRIYTCAFALELPQKPKLSRQKSELRRLQWVSLRELYDDPGSAHITRIVDVWRNKK